MKLKFKNLGVIKSGEIDLSKELIILTGGNNTGKSYVSYLLYGLYRNWNNENKNKFYKFTSKYIEEVENSYPNVKLKINFKENLKLIINEFVKSIESNLTDRFHSLFSSKQINPITNLFVSENQLNQTYESIISLNASFFVDYMERVNFSVKEGIALYEGKYNKEISKDFAITLSKDQIIDTIIYYIIERIGFSPNLSPVNLYYKFFPAERSSINLFSKEIIQNKAKKLDEISLLSEKERRKVRLTTNFPLPINDYLYFINDLKDKDNYQSNYGYIADEIETLIDGSVTLNEFDEIIFNPKNSKKQLDLHISSSTVKSLSGLVFYFRYYAMKNDVIFIDEPELNLHPDNQIKFARILAKIINNEIKMVISTHSDYIIKEFNNLIMLNNDKGGKLLKKLGYNKEYVIDNERIGAYYFPSGNNTVVQELQVSKTGISVESIDNTIDNQDYNGETIYYTLFEK